MADEARPAELREVSDERPVFDQAPELIGDVAEVVRARWLHEKAPDLWPVLVVDENGWAKGLPLHRRAGASTEGEIAGDALVLQERRSASNVEPVSGFSRAEAEQT